MKNERGFALVLLLVGLIFVVIVGAVSYRLGKSSNKISGPNSNQSGQAVNSPPVISTIQSPKNTSDWTEYSIDTLKMKFKLPSELAKKYGKLVEKETQGERGSELKVSFANNSTGLIITAQSPEYTPASPKPVKLTEQEQMDLAIGGPGISIPSSFQGFKYENSIYYGVLPFGQLQDLPSEYVTQYRTGGKDILKVKALYGQYGMVNHKIYPEDPPKIWGIINGTGNKIYPGFTIQGVLGKDLAEQTFEQLLSTFSGE